MAVNPTFSRYKFTPKAGQVLKYIKNQGYISAPAPAKAAAVKAVTPAPFDYNKAIQGEGIYQADVAGINADSGAAQVARDNAVKALRFQFNDPSNPFNAVGEADRARKSTVANMIAERTARGVGGSGGTTLSQMDIGHDYSKGVYDLNNQFNERVGSLDSQLAETLRANAQKGVGALGDVTSRLIDNGVGLGAGTSGGSSPGGVGSSPAAVAAAMNKPGSFDLPGAKSSFPNGIYPGAAPAPAFDYNSIKAGYYNPQTGKRLAVQVGPWENSILQAALANGDFNAQYAKLKAQGHLGDVKLTREQLRSYLLRLP